MTDTEVSSRFSIEPFDHQAHDRSEFDCGVAVLNDWLQTKAGQFERRDLARVYVLVERGQVVVKGYYALANHTVIYDTLPEDQAKGLPRIDMPVVLLGRLAVDRSVQGQRLGEFLLINALRRAEYLSRKIGIRAVEVEALDDEARRFYMKYGFLVLRDDPRHLFLPIHMVRNLKMLPL